MLFSFQYAITVDRALHKMRCRLRNSTCQVAAVDTIHRFLLQQSHIAMVTEIIMHIMTIITVMDTHMIIIMMTTIMTHTRTIIIIQCTMTNKLPLLRK